MARNELRLILSIAIAALDSIGYGALTPATYQRTYLTPAGEVADTVDLAELARVEAMHADPAEYDGRYLL